MQIALTNRTEWVSGIISAIGLIYAGRLETGKTTPEKKNIGDMKPVK